MRAILDNTKKRLLVVLQEDSLSLGMSQVVILISFLHSALDKVLFADYLFSDIIAFGGTGQDQFNREVRIS